MMARPRKVAMEPAQTTPTQVIQQMEKAFHQDHWKKVTVDEFVGEWNRLSPHFAGGMQLGDNRKSLVRAVLGSLSLLME
jgi:hypothetical protein